MNTCRLLNNNIIKQPITTVDCKILSKNSKIFTMGSCFAVEIQKYLADRGFNVLVKQKSDRVRELVWYNTYTMRYEFERVKDIFKQDENDIWNTRLGYQDPYRRATFAPTKEELWQKINDINENIKTGILTANVFIITLGLTEVFFHNTSGNAMCASPGYAGTGITSDDKHSNVKFTTFLENYENIDTILKIIHEVNPNANVILTVSPVPLAKTFSKYDHLIANTTSKSILRAVAAEIVDKYDFCHYFHSYELAMALDRSKVFNADGRHVNPEFVKLIMSEFTKYFIK